jgi:hypothetical protein
MKTKFSVCMRSYMAMLILFAMIAGCADPTNTEPKTYTGYGTPAVSPPTIPALAA